LVFIGGVLDLRVLVFQVANDFLLLDHQSLVGVLAFFIGEVLFFQNLDLLLVFFELFLTGLDDGGHLNIV